MKNVKFRVKTKSAAKITRPKFRGKNPNSAKFRGPRKTVGPTDKAGSSESHPIQAPQSTSWVASIERATSLVVSKASIKVEVAETVNEQATVMN